MQKKYETQLVIPTSYEEEAFNENGGEQEPRSHEKKKIWLGAGWSTYWPYQSGRVDRYGMTYPEAMLKAEGLGYRASDVKSETGDIEHDCDMASYPDGGGTSETTTVNYYVLEK